MEYEVALSKAWQNINSLTQEKNHVVRFLDDNYSVDLEKKFVFSLSCNIPAKAYISILILHYLIKKLKGLPSVKGEWISFKEFGGGQGYYPSFKKRVIDPIKSKYSTNPDGLFELVERFNAKRVQLAEISIALEIFDGVPILITFWRGDEEFGPEVNVLFDKSIMAIFCTEDVVVFSEFLAHNI